MDNISLIKSEVKRFAESELLSRAIPRSTQREPFKPLLAKLELLQEFTTKLSSHMDMFFVDNNIDLTEDEVEQVERAMPEILESAIDRHFSR